MNFIAKQDMTPCLIAPPKSGAFISTPHSDSPFDVSKWRDLQYNHINYHYITA